MNTEFCLLLGARIKERRKELKLTQSAVCGDRITRNMLSCIENGSAFPSVDTLMYLAERLNMPVEYFLSKDSNNASLYKRIEHINKIRKAYDSAQYKRCVSLCEKISSTDDEILMILAECKLYLAKENMDQCKLSTANKLLDECTEIANKGIYSKNRYSATVDFYKYLIKCVRNNEFPSFVSYKQSDVILSDCEFLIFVYFISLYNDGKNIERLPIPKFINKSYDFYINSVLFINDNKYREGIDNLLKVLNCSPNFFLQYFTIEKLELCYKELGDYKKAYEYAKSRLDLLDKFND